MLPQVCLAAVSTGTRGQSTPGPEDGLCTKQAHPHRRPPPSSQPNTDTTGVPPPKPAGSQRVNKLKSGEWLVTHRRQHHAGPQCASEEKAEAPAWPEALQFSQQSHWKRLGTAQLVTPFCSSKEDPGLPEQGDQSVALRTWEAPLLIHRLGR